LPIDADVLCSFNSAHTAITNSHNSLRVKSVALDAAANPEKHPRLRLMLAEVPEVMQCCEERGERGEHLITDLRRNRENRRNN